MNEQLVSLFVKVLFVNYRVRDLLYGVISPFLRLFENSYCLLITLQMYLKMIFPGKDYTPGQLFSDTHAGE
jgi:hypothetical protein